MVDGGEEVSDFAAVAIGTVFCGDVTCHDLLAEDVAVALYLFSLAGTRMAAVKHTWVALVISDGPYHTLQDEARKGLLALHEGEYKIGIVEIKLAYEFRKT